MKARTQRVSSEVLDILEKEIGSDADPDLRVIDLVEDVVADILRDEHTPAEVLPYLAGVLARLSEVVSAERRRRIASGPSGRPPSPWDELRVLRGAAQ